MRRREKEEAPGEGVEEGANRCTWLKVGEKG